MTGPKERRRRRGIVAAVVAGGLVFLAACSAGTTSGDGIPDVDGPHRVPIAGSAGGNAGYHWVALGTDWTVSTGDPLKSLLSGEESYETVGTDGTRAFTFRGGLSGGAPSFEYPPGKLTAYDAANGTMLWTRTFQLAPDTVPVGVGDVVVLASAKTRIDDEATGVTYVALDSRTGKERWRRPVTQPSLSAVNDRISTPGVFLDGLFYYGDGDTIYGVDPRTGAVKYRLARTNFTVISGPVVSGDQLVAVFDPTVENETTDREELQVLRANLTPVTAYTYPSATGDLCVDKVVADSTRFVESFDDTALCVLERQAGGLRLLWSRRLDDEGLIPSPAVLGVVPLWSYKHGIKGLDIRTGKTLWTLPPLPGDREEIAVVDNTLFSLGHRIQIIDPKTGKVIFDAQPRMNGGNTYGGDALPVLAAGHIVMARADGFWGFN